MTDTRDPRIAAFWSICTRALPTRSKIDPGRLAA
jgi:hypothetical protein